MSDVLDALLAKLTPEERAQLAARLAAGIATSGEQPSEPEGTVDVSGTLRGNAVGVNYGAVQAFFDGKPGERGEILLADYLVALESDCDALRLGRLRERRQSGAERRTAPELRLQAVYTSLTTNGELVTVHQRTRPMRQVQRLQQWLERHPRDEDNVAPECVRHLSFFTEAQKSRGIAWQDRYGQVVAGPDAMVDYRVTRPELAIEAIRGERRLVLLGEPGYGKSTVLRYLALLLARRIRGEDVTISGWAGDDLPVPILCPLGSVAAALAAHGGDADAALWQALGDVLDGQQGVSAGLRDFLKPAVRSGGVLLLFDGLDELPAGTGADSPRLRVAQAVQRLAARVRARIVVTSRVLPYRAAADWQFSEGEGWRERTIQPLAFGQVRTFVHGWYRALVPNDPDLSEERAGARAEALIGELSGNERLRPLVQSPLLLTMLALLHYNSDGDIPRDRARLYNECVQLLLERWEPVRTPGVRDRLSRLQQLRARLPGLETDKLRDVLHELAFQAHDMPPGDDGRGLIDRYQLTGRLVEFFKRLRGENPVINADTFLEIVREEAGLLVARDDERAFAFPHLTFQEYLAACWLADQPDMIERSYMRWSGADRERWRQMLVLLAGRLRQKGQKDVERDGVPWLELLTGATVRGQPKDATQRRRDTVLAALSYAEMGGRAALSTSLRDLVTQVERPLREAIVGLLEEPDLAIPTSDRIAAARVLADLTDSRYPVALDAWRSELARRSEDFGQLAGYWHYVRPGAYRIGGWEQGEAVADITLPAFWIARFPITVAQYALFVEVGYGRAAKRWWTSEGWKWKGDQVEPAVWQQAPYDGANQPVIGVSWYEATAFCAWLSEQLRDVLPADYVVRLPTEAEWEVAAAYDAEMQRRPYPWGDDKPTPEQAIYNASQVGRPAPAGCCPAGTAACGALDMAGNVWEWTASSDRQYPRGSGAEVKDFTTNDWDVPLRGGSWVDVSASVRCGARVRNYPIVRLVLPKWVITQGWEAREGGYSQLDNCVLDVGRNSPSLQ